MRTTSALPIFLVILALTRLSCSSHLVSVRHIPHLVSITIWERSGATRPEPYTFAVNSRELMTQLPDPLTTRNRDFMGVGTREFYDVFYSDADGKVNPDGKFVTVEAVFDEELPAGGGLNLAEVQLNYSDGTTKFASGIASFFSFGDNARPERAKNAVDGNLETHTSMGNTAGHTQRLRITVGFGGISSKPPALEELPARPLDLDGLEWMVGYWVSETADTYTEEFWLHPSGGMMLRLHREVFDAERALFEYKRIESRPDGIFYVAGVEADSETSFDLVEISGTRAVFEDPDLDYPQRITYWREDYDTLKLRMEGEYQGRSRSEEWTWHRTEPPW